MYFGIYVFRYLRISVFTYFGIYVFRYLRISVFTYFGIYVFRYFGIYVFTYSRIYVFTYLRIYLFTYFGISVFRYFGISVFTYFGIYVFRYFGIYLFTYLRIYVFTYLRIYVFTTISSFWYSLTVFSAVSNLTSYILCTSGLKMNGLFWAHPLFLTKILSTNTFQLKSCTRESSICLLGLWSSEVSPRTIRKKESGPELTLPREIEGRFL